MGPLGLIVALGLATAWAQSNHAINSFAYLGCSSLDLNCFSAPVELDHSGPLTPEICQQACQGHRYAALLPTSCRCGDDPKAIKPLEEGACNQACMGNPSDGMCGGICPGEGPGTANVYTKTDTVPSQAPLQTVHTTSTLALPAISLIPDESCTSGQLSETSTAPQTSAILTLPNPATEAPTTATLFLTSSEPSVAPSGAASSPAQSTSEICTTNEQTPDIPNGQQTSSTAALSSPNLEAPTSSIPVSVSSAPIVDYTETTPSPALPASSIAVGTSISEQSTPVSGQSVTVTAEAVTSGSDQGSTAVAVPTPSFAGPSAYQSSSVQSPLLTPAAPSSFTSVTESAALPQTSPDEWGSGQQVTDTTNSTSDSTPESQGHPSTSTLWSRPSDVVNPTGQPPAPAQVPGSDSTHSMVPPLATIGGLAILAAIIM